MVAPLYKDEKQARRVVNVVQEELHRSLSRPVRLVNGRISIAPEILAGTLSTWAMQNIRLNRQTRALVEYPCRSQGLVVETLGEYPLFTEMRLVQGPITDVVIVPAEQDPLFASGQFPLPRSVKTRMQLMEQIGVPLERMFTYIAHEVPANSVAMDRPLPLEAVTPPPSAHTLRQSERLGAIAHVSTISALKGFRRGLTTSVRGMVVGALATGVAAALLLDPIIFGALADERGMATWVVLAQWVW